KAIHSTHSNLSSYNFRTEKDKVPSKPAKQGPRRIPVADATYLPPVPLAQTGRQVPLPRSGRLARGRERKPRLLPTPTTWPFAIPACSIAKQTSLDGT